MKINKQVTFKDYVNFFWTWKYIVQAANVQISKEPGKVFRRQDNQAMFSGMRRRSLWALESCHYEENPWEEAIVLISTDCGYLTDVLKPSIFKWNMIPVLIDKICAWIDYVRKWLTKF